MPDLTLRPSASKPGNVIQMPAAGGKPAAVAKTTVTEALDTVTALETGCADLTENEVGEVHAALVELVAKLAKRLPARKTAAAR